MDQAPTPAERARTILTVGTTAQVRTPGQATETDADDLSMRSLALCADPLPADHRTHPVEVEVADAAPLAVRDRIRGRVEIVGHAVALSDCASLHVHPTSVVLREDTGTTTIAVTDLVSAEPDPVAPVEASMLGHLETQHGDVLTRLSRLVPHRHLQGVIRVWPYRLDRHGLVLRMEYATGHHDERLPFRVRLDDAGQLREEMAALIERAGQHRPGCVRPLHGSLAAVLQAGPAVRRICSRDEPGA